MKKTTHTQILKMVMTALFAALTFVATYIIRIPTVTGGYIHLGDCFVLLSGWMLGPVYGVLAAGIGSMLTDIAVGYVAWAPATLVIKGLVALTGWGLYAALAKLLRGGWKIAGRVGAAVAAELLMALGYFLFEAAVLGQGLTAAAAGVPANLVQGAVGVAAGVLVATLLSYSKLTDHTIFQA